MFPPSCLEMVLLILSYTKNDTGMNVGNKITQKPHSSWVSFYPIIQLFFRCGIPYFCKKTVLFYKHGISKTLYPKIAQTFQVSSSCVERDIRTAISVCWTRGNRDLLFSLSVHPVLTKPTNSEFFDILSSYIKYYRAFPACRQEA